MENLPHDFFDKQFPAQNNEARRQLSVPFNAPALTWHSGFWRPASDATSIRDWYNAIDRAVLLIYYWAREICPTIRTSNLENGTLNLFANKAHVLNGKFFGKYGMLPSGALLINDILPDSAPPNRDRIKFLLRYSNASLTIISEISEEFWTLSFILEPALPEYYRHTRAECESNQKIDAVRETFFSMLKALNAQTMARIQNQVAETEYRELPLAEFTKFLGDEIVDKVIGDDCFNNGAPWGGKFLDFKGIIAPIAFPENDREGCSTQRAPPNGEALVVDWEFSGKWRDHNHTVEKTILPFATSTPPRECPTPREWLCLVTKVWPAIQRLHNHSLSPEMSISTFQRRRSLYISSLGRTSQPGDLDNTNRFSSVKYIVLVGHHSKWEVGRLVDRLHRAGTMRVSAMRDLREIERASERLDNLRRAITEERNAARRKLGRWDVSKFVDNLRVIQNSLPEGLDYRIFRSQYYVQRFSFYADALGIDRVTGFQQYDEFVKRRLSAAIEKINFTLERQRQVRFELDVLLQQVQAEKAIDLASQSVVLNDRAEALIGMGLVYYLGHIVASIAGYFGDHDSDYVEHTIQPLTFGWFFGFFVMFLFLRHAWPSWKKRIPWLARSRSGLSKETTEKHLNP